MLDEIQLQRETEENLASTMHNIYHKKSKESQLDMEEKELEKRLKEIDGERKNPEKMERVRAEEIKRRRLKFAELQKEQTLSKNQLNLFFQNSHVNKKGEVIFS